MTSEIKIGDLVSNGERIFRVDGFGEKNDLITVDGNLVEKTNDRDGCPIGGGCWDYLINVTKKEVK